ncbi:YqiA/YcfP family alpha/beta fold hydrolase [Comamonas resistens]|uniref:YqiA/YcfP family alpha/beta fold hydrolase n=1 Tax=Comamonas resistens TaxID=3046670 RepID=A0ABY8SS72_9BURK|nr:YqiA/YcfP family alpha/beta fold hydrolase [Comamonas resistens]MDL5036447.1 YqiA/YcfP family alpha/beta fold hydrolase [Comamonas resistens]WHS64789.1 YqiA/YcfP family alpha/beta fold hydrolase [Comamonas resistens]
MTTTHLLYLHGFRSSPQSNKARILADHIATKHSKVRWWCPQLPPSPREATALIAEGIANWPRQNMAVVGSSLGGYYASWVAQLARCKSVMINPAVNPARDLEHHIGEQSNWHDPEDVFYFRPEYIEELRQLDTRDLTAAAPEMVLIAQGDEVLDWLEMSERYPHALQLVQEGGDHALSNFPEYLERIDEFLALA